MIEYYINKFTSLRTDASPSRWPATTKHRAPHKPILLLAVMDLFAEGLIKGNLIELTPDLGELFTLYWSRVMPLDRRGILALPFFHLKSDGFWHLLPRPGEEAILSAARQIKSLGHLSDTIFGAQVDNDLYDLFCSEESRDILRAVLLKTYFAPEVCPTLLEQAMINVQAFKYSQELLEKVGREEFRESTAEEKHRSPVRDQGFRRAVVTAYDHRCALCGIRILTADGHTAVDAAHIIPWNISHNDDPRNGMALCRLCHWGFDEGLIGISPQCLVLASKQLTYDTNIPGHLVTLIGRSIIGPIDRALWPAVKSVNWHAQHIFCKR